MIGYEYVNNRGATDFAEYPEKYRAILEHTLSVANKLARDDNDMVVVERKDSEKTRFMIDLPHGVPGFITVQNGKVIEASDMHRYMIGWNGKQVRDECRRKKWRLRKEKRSEVA